MGAEDNNFPAQISDAFSSIRVKVKNLFLFPVRE